MQTTTAAPTSVEIRYSETATPSLSPLSLPLAGEQFVEGYYGPLKRAFVTQTNYSISQADTVSLDAEWLGVVEQRINSSIASTGYDLQGDNAWLQPEVGRAAIDFFRQTSRALPGEPYIYASRGGELVAEFSAGHAKLTCLISPQFVLLFGVARDEIIEKKFLPQSENVSSLHRDIQEIANFLSAK